MLKFKRQAWLWAGLILSTFLLSGCGSSSSSSATIEDPFPFGLDSVTFTNDYDGDSLWDERETSTFEYDAKERVIFHSTTTEWDADGDGTADEKYIYTERYDPDVVPDYEDYKSVKGGSSPFLEYALILESSEEYQKDKENPEAPLYLAYSHVYTYSFDADGNETNYTRTEQGFDPDDTRTRHDVRTRVTEYDANGNETSSLTNASYDNEWEKRSYSYDETYTYDANGNRLSRTEINSYDDNPADGTIDEVRTYSYTYTYDANGNRTSYTYTRTSDNPVGGDLEENSTTAIIYTNTYDDAGNLIQVVASGDELYREDYSYDAAGNMTGRTRAYNYNSETKAYTSFSIRSYSFDSAGRLTSNIYRYESNNDDIEGIDSWYSYGDTYEYSETGLLALSSYENQQDNDNNGTLESWETQTNSYTYQDGNLASYRYDNVDKITSDESSEGETFTYEAGALTESVEWEDSDSDEIYDWSETRTITYDEVGRVSGVSTTGGKYSTTLAFTYDVDDSVTINMSETGGESGVGLLSFGSSGIPTGTVDFPIMSEWVWYPEGDSEEDNEIRYEMTIPMPKILAILYADEGGGRPE